MVSSFFALFKLPFLTSSILTFKQEATYVLGSAANSFIDGSAIRLSYARQMDGGARHHSSHGHHSTASEQAAWMAYNQQYANNNTNQQSQSWPTPPG